MWKHLSNIKRCHKTQDLKDPNSTLILGLIENKIFLKDGGH